MIAQLPIIARQFGIAARIVLWVAFFAWVAGCTDIAPDSRQRIRALERRLDQLTPTVINLAEDCRWAGYRSGGFAGMPSRVTHHYQCGEIAIVIPGNLEPFGTGLSAGDASPHLGQ